MKAIKRIGILTLHRSINEGAVLQANALTHTLRSLLPAVDCDIIDIYCPHKHSSYSKDQSARSHAIRGFISQNFSSAPNPLPFDQDTLRREIDRKGISHVVIGSDVVWNLRYRPKFPFGIPGAALSKQENPFFSFYPNIFWTTPATGVPTIAYAASVGETLIHQIPWHHRRTMLRNLSKFSALSVRDRNSLSMLSGLGVTTTRDVTLVPDPTITHHHLKSDSRGHEPYQVSPSKTRAPFIGLYFDIDDSLFNELGNSLPGITPQFITYQHRPKPHMLVTSVDEWRESFGKVSLCLVDRMHPTIFSILSNTPFVVIDRHASGQVHKSKTFELLEDLELLDVYARSDSVNPDHIRNLLEYAIRKTWDWHAINLRVRSLGKQGVDFLNQSFTQSS